MHPFVAAHKAEAGRIYQVNKLTAQCEALERRLKDLKDPKEKAQARELLKAGKKELARLAKLRGPL